MRPAERFRKALEKEKPLQIVGVPSALVAMMAEKEGFHALYLSGAGVANFSYGLPDLGVTTLSDVVFEAKRIAHASSLPLLVDIDTGWGSDEMIRRTISEMIEVGVAGVHIEDQVFHKRCGHREGKELVSKEEMQKRLKAACCLKEGSDIVIMARTDALANEGMEKTIERLLGYKEAGAEMIFLEAATSADDYLRVKEALNLPLLANMTEFGKTPLLTKGELKRVGVDMALYPLSAMRVMNKAAQELFQELRSGTQKKSLSYMQTREELYQLLDYERLEQEVNNG